MNGRPSHKRENKMKGQISLDDVADKLEAFETPGDIDYFRKLADQELLDRVLPPKPDKRIDPMLHKHWIEMLHGVTSVVEAEFAGDLGSETERSFWQTTLESSQNWSGALCTACHGLRFRSVVGKWRVPRVKKAANSATFQPNSSIWIGFGGHRRWSTAMPQMGTEQLAESHDGTQPERYRAWVQWWVKHSKGPPYQAKYFKSPVLNPGDTVLCWIELLSPRKVRFFLRKKGDPKLYRKALNMTASTVKGVEAFGHSAQWIVERPRVADGTGKNYYPLADFTKVKFDRWHASSGCRQKTSPVMIRLIERRASPQRIEPTSKPGLRVGHGRSLVLSRIGQTP